MDRFKLSLGVAGVVIVGLIGALVYVLTGGDDNGTATTADGGQTSSVPVVRDERKTTTDLVGRTVYYPKNRLGDLLPNDGTALKNESDRGWVSKTPVIEWQRLRNDEPGKYPIDLPFSASDGPWVLIDGVPAGYSRTPQGAAIAAMWAVNILAFPGADMLNMSKAYMPIHVKDELRATDPTLSEIADYEGLEYVFVPRAYKVSSFDSDHALVNLAVGTKSKMTLLEVPMTWDNEDKTWRLTNEQVFSNPEQTADILESELATWVKL